MSKDKNGVPLAVGDKVTISATIVKIDEADDYCSLALETDEAHHLTEAKTAVVLDARQVTKTPWPFAPIGGWDKSGTEE